jgi:ribosome biogenesis GTPase
MSGGPSQAARKTRQRVTNTDDTPFAARIVAAYGRHFVAAAADGVEWRCVTRGRRADVVCGDQVMLQAGDPALIERVLPRRNTLWREDAWRAKVFAANLDLLLVVTAAEPSPNLELVGRALIAARAEDIEAAIVINKADLPATAALRARLQPLAALGYPLLELSVRADPAHARELLRPWLDGRTSMLIGASGVGKSTLVNALVPGLQLATQAISDALDSGRHTTTATRLYALPGFAPDSALLDSPGFQAFGLHQLSVSQLQHALPELESRRAQCRFHNCTHRQEPGCAVRDAVRDGAIDGERYALYLRVLQELLDAPRN